MLCYLQIGLAALGVAVARKDAIRVGGQECGGPFPVMIGLVLILQCVVSLLFGFKVGIEEGRKAARAGKSQPDYAAVRQMQEKYLWVDVCLPVGALCLAGILLYAGLKDPQAEPEWKQKLRDRMHDEAFGPDDDGDELGRRYGGRGRGDYS